ncbi:hypothetical protein [Actinacidiphila yeochonensis]|uniref:hypothetical protein n=1 Tax=Actinacidiphila yeochonensis TaxID=89050 RepID=UPI0007C85592|nr:hypothetical protein [Actinacidiphila yeochonensis]
MSEQPRQDGTDARGPGETEPQPGQQEPTDDPQAAEEGDSPQDPWAARLELIRHAPASFGGSLVGGSQTGVSGGNVAGDVIMGTKIEQHIRLGGSHHASGDVPASELEERARVFAGYEELVHPLLGRLREERVLVLSGAPFSGRHSAALMLLHAVKAVPVRALDPKTTPALLKDEVVGTSRGYLVSDLVTSRDNQLRDVDVWAVRDELEKKNAYLVVTVDLYAVLRGIRVVEWRPPSPEAVLRSQLHALVDDPPRERELLALPAAREFLAHKDHQLREAAVFAKALAGYVDGEAGHEELAAVSRGLLRKQVQEWFSDDQTQLRDKAFLLSLAAFDEAAYALTAELSDDLFTQFQRTEDAGSHSRVGIFGTSITKRLLLARAEEYPQKEHTEWGPVTQRMARFLEPRTAGEVLREVWTGHPSARPALIRWLERLAEDGRPLVRTRAAVTAAVLADADLPSAMALIIERWAGSKRYRTCLVAANTLAMAHAIGAPNIPGILRSWCDTDSGVRLRWTAIRVYGLIGAKMPQAALEALVDAARVADDEAEVGHIAESVALLLTDQSSAVRGQILHDLVQLLQGKAPADELVLRAFVLACTHTDDRLLLQWYAEAAAQGSTEDARLLAYLWRTALSDLRYTGDALKALGGWVRAADDDLQVEGQLAALLPALALTAEDRKRLSHMLRTLHDRHGEPLKVTTRLLNPMLGPGVNPPPVHELTNAEQGEMPHGGLPSRT